MSYGRLARIIDRYGVSALDVALPEYVRRKSSRE